MKKQLTITTNTEQLSLSETVTLLKKQIRDEENKF